MTAVSQNTTVEPRTYRDLLSAAVPRIRVALRDALSGSADTPWLDAVVMMRHASGQSQERLIAAMNDPVDASCAQRFESLVKLRCTGLPVSYVIGKKEFYGRDFRVTTDVLVPRPDTETLVDVVLDLLRGVGPAHIHDACTGSGCVAITIAAETACPVTASDVSPAAIAVAEENAVRLLEPDRRPRFFRSDLLTELPDALGRFGLGAPAIVSANPPYLTDTEYGELVRRQWPEPALALRGGIDGVDAYARLAGQALSCLAPRGYLVVEIGSSQGPRVRALLESAGFVDVATITDLGGRDRVCVGKRP
ncbi:MAG: peptide chain release factor N(5)-glutamine methyltransferase [Spirochaetaceae bacterium]|nr:MAG: peptide chain release factor N(5)-glutamine methyltransferase [Spirochaetaceae bacterium]